MLPVNDRVSKRLRSPTSKHIPTRSSCKRPRSCMRAKSSFICWGVVKTVFSSAKLMLTSRSCAIMGTICVTRECTPAARPTCIISIIAPTSRARAMFCCKRSRPTACNGVDAVDAWRLMAIWRDRPVLKANSRSGAGNSAAAHPVPSLFLSGNHSNASNPWAQAKSKGAVRGQAVKALWFPMRKVFKMKEKPPCLVHRCE